MELKPFYKKKWFIVIAAIVVIGLIGSSLGGDKDRGSKSAETWQTASETPAGASASVEVPKEYTVVTADQMIQDVEDNALKAQNIYKDRYFEISGKLSNVDSSGKYIGIDGANGDFNFVNIQCYIKSDEQKNIVAELSNGQNVTIKGKVTSVGEVMGYSVDIDEIIAQ